MKTQPIMIRKQYGTLVVLLAASLAGSLVLIPQVAEAQESQPGVSERGVQPPGPPSGMMQLPTQPQPPAPPPMMSPTPPGAGLLVGYLKIDGFRGIAPPPFQGWIPFQSMSYGLRQVGTARTGGDEVTMSDITIVKDVGPESPSLALKCSTAEVIKEAVFVVASGNYVPIRVTLSDVVISGVSFGFHSGDARPQETVTFNFQRVKWEYIPTSGSPEKTGWDLGKKTKQ